LAEAIREEFGVEPTLIEGRGGIFDVHLDKALIYSKYQTGRFPEPHEVLDRLTSKA